MTSSSAIPFHIDWSIAGHFLRKIVAEEPCLDGKSHEWKLEEGEEPESMGCCYCANCKRHLDYKNTESEAGLN